jgi:hypothetical protein
MRIHRRTTSDLDRLTCRIDQWLTSGLKTLPQACERSTAPGSKAASTIWIGWFTLKSCWPCLAWLCWASPGKSGLYLGVQGVL